MIVSLRNPDHSDAGASQTITVVVTGSGGDRPENHVPAATPSGYRDRSRRSDDHQRYRLSTQRYHAAVYLTTLLLLATGWWLPAGEELRRHSPWSQAYRTSSCTSGSAGRCCWWPSFLCRSRCAVSRRSCARQFAPTRVTAPGWCAGRSPSPPRASRATRATSIPASQELEPPFVEIQGSSTRAPFRLSRLTRSEQRATALARSTEQFVDLAELARAPDEGAGSHYVIFLLRPRLASRLRLVEAVR